MWKERVKSSKLRSEGLRCKREELTSEIWKTVKNTEEEKQRGVKSSNTERT